MRAGIISLLGLALTACSPSAGEPDDAAARQELVGPEPIVTESAPPVNVTPPQSAPAQKPLPQYVDMSPTDSMPACRSGLVKEGLDEAERDIMTGPMAGVCPNNGVSEGRIREILNTLWTKAGCHQHSPIEVAKTLDSGACGGDAG